MPNEEVGGDGASEGDALAARDVPENALDLIPIMALGRRAREAVEEANNHRGDVGVGHVRAV